MTIQSYPLQFPENKIRNKNPERARFKTKSIFYTIKELLSQLNRLGAKQITISTNLLLKADGFPYSNQRVDDVGVAVYFTLKDTKQCFPCDRWNKIEDNLWAICKSIEAIRGLERWGAKDMLESAFEGFRALPSPEQVTKTKARYFSGGMSLEEAKETFKNLVKIMHPDMGGTQEEFMELNQQYNHFKQSMEKSK